mgnify:CR=1 FL=1
MVGSATEPMSCSNAATSRSASSAADTGIPAADGTVFYVSPLLEEASTSNEDDVFDVYSRSPASGINSRSAPSTARSWRMPLSTAT